MTDAVAFPGQLVARSSEATVAGRWARISARPIPIIQIIVNAITVGFLALTSTVSTAFCRSSGTQRAIAAFGTISNTVNATANTRNWTRKSFTRSSIARPSSRHRSAILSPDSPDSRTISRMTTYTSNTQAPPRRFPAKHQPVRISPVPSRILHKSELSISVKQ